MRLRQLSLIALIASLSVTASSKAGEPTASDLIALAPVITSSDEKFQSIELGGYWKDDEGNTLLRFRSFYRAPDKHALLITDGTDGTPISFVSDHKWMIYDPLNGCVHYSPEDASARTWIRVEENSFRFSWPQSTDPKKTSNINLDIKSMFQGSSRGDEVVKTGEGKYRLTRTSGSGNFYVFHIDTSSKNPYQKVELINGHTRTVRFCVDNILVNGSLGDEKFAFPGKQRLSEKILVNDWPGDGLLKTIEDLGSVTRTYYARIAIYNPEFRDSQNLVNLFGLSKINWEELKKNDEKYSRALKELVISAPKIP